MNLMNRKVTHFLIISSLFVSHLGCGTNLTDAVEDLREDAYEGGGDAVYGKAGDIIIKKGELYYANAAYGVSGPDEIMALSDSARRLVIQKLLLRRMAIESGRDKGYYDSEEAARFLAPRMEKLLEEYYYHKATDADRIYAEAEKLKPDDEALREFLATDPALQGKGLTVEQIRRERDVLARRIARRREEIARQKAIDELLKSSPPMEITMPDIGGLNGGQP